MSEENRYGDNKERKDLVCEPQPAYMLSKQQGEYTIGDYFALSKEDRKELIDGVFYDMASPTHIHQHLCAQIYVKLDEFVLKNNGTCMAMVSPLDIQLDCDDKTMLQPDVLVICDRDKFKYGRVYGAPDFIVEVLSPSTSKKDMYIKFYKYLNAGVREYWIVAPEKKRVYVYDMVRETPVEIYTFEDQVPVKIFNSKCMIDFNEISSRMEFLYERM